MQLIKDFPTTVDKQWMRKKRWMKKRFFLWFPWLPLTANLAVSSNTTIIKIRIWNLQLVWANLKRYLKWAARSSLLLTKIWMHCFHLNDCCEGRSSGHCRQRYNFLKTHTGRDSFCSQLFTFISLFYPEGHLILAAFKRLPTIKHASKAEGRGA